jgi:hypothetical protein
MAGVENWKKLNFLENVNFKPPLVFEKLLISQNRDGQLTVKFYRQHDPMHIYRLRPINKYFYVVCDRERYEKRPQKRPIRVVSKMAIHPRKLGLLNISQ